MSRSSPRARPYGEAADDGLPNHASAARAGDSGEADGTAGHRPSAFLLPIPGPSPAPRTAGTARRRAGWIVLSALIGVGTHLVRDALTHHDGFFVTHAP
ncbi:DUF4184 family protein [Streptomyces sp. SD11]|uniref:DUF4184 family protein n=1 Tax=Streptomyces sp. SD11 TaxID=3452209 RepID=UPI003F8AAB72